MATELSTNLTTKTAGEQTYTLLTLAGQIDESNLTELSDVVDPLVGGDSAYLVFDLTNLEFVNSKVIGYLASVHGQLAENNQKMIFVSPNQAIMDILDLVGLNQIVPILENEAKAIESMQSGEL